MVIPFREWEPKNSSHNGWNSQGIRREGGYGRFLPLSTGSAAPSPHAAAKPLRPTDNGQGTTLSLVKSRFHANFRRNFNVFLILHDAAVLSEIGFVRSLTGFRLWPAIR